VRLEEVDRRLDIVLQLDLEQDRIGLEINEAIAGMELGQWLRPAVKVDDQKRRVVQAPQLSEGHPKAAVVLVEPVERPLVLEPEPAHDALDEGGRHRRAVILLPLHQHRRGAGMCLDVVGLVPESLEPGKVVDRLPDDPGDGYASHHPEQDDLLARPCEQGHLQRVLKAMLRASNQNFMCLHLVACLGTLASKWRGPGVARRGRREPEYWTVFGRLRTKHGGEPTPPFQVERFWTGH
jgi:hypothetical protein